MVVVDDDIDPTNTFDVLWAMSTRCDPAQDIDLIRGTWSGPLDPRLDRATTTNSRALITAVRPFGRDFPAVAEASPSCATGSRPSSPSCSTGCPLPDPGTDAERTAEMSSSTYEQDGASVVAVPKSRPEKKLGFATLFAACLAVCVAEITIAMPTVLNGLFQSRLHADGSEIAWITDASLLPVTALALTFGVLGDKFGRKRLLVLGAVALIAGHLVTATAAGTAQLWTGRAIAGLGAAALFPTSLAVVAIGTRTGHERARGVTLGPHRWPPAPRWPR